MNKKIVSNNQEDEPLIFISNKAINLYQDNIKLQERINKTIEYIELVKDFNKEYEKEWEFDIFIPHLLDILKGSDKE